MNDPMLEMESIAAEQAAPGEKLPRTHGHAMAAIDFTLSWESGNARHVECLVAGKPNLWRDILPPQMEGDLMDKPVGHVAAQGFAGGELLTHYRDQDCLHVPVRAFRGQNASGEDCLITLYQLLLESIGPDLVQALAETGEANRALPSTSTGDAR